MTLILALELIERKEGSPKAQTAAVVKQMQNAAEEVEHAVRIVELFEENPGAGTIGMDGRMIDKPHLVQALRLLELARHSKT